MKLKFSHTTINSFCGDVLPLSIVATNDISNENIKWYSENENVSIKNFSDEANFAFSDKVLITLRQVGSSKIFAEIGGEKLCCEVTVRERRRFKKGEKLQYFAGDLHAHTSHNHDYKTFPIRESEFPIDCYRQVKEEGMLDFFAMTDHAGLVCKKDFVRGFFDAEEVKPINTVIFAGCESQCNPSGVEADRFGLLPKSGGELVSFNSDTYTNAVSWEQFTDAFKDTPLPIISFAHPQIIGWVKKGNGNFDFEKINTPELKKLVKMIEMGNGEDRETNAINEYSYSVALDCGFKVSPCSTTDAHGPKWGYAIASGKTIIMAPDKSKEMLLDALNENRVYASESGQVKLHFTVNGCIAGETMPLSDTYNFHVETETFSGEEKYRPIKCRVISDGGRTLKTIEGDLSSFDFEIKSQTAGYFYLRLTDINGKKTWSAPVWTGRPCQYKEQPNLLPIDKTDFSALDISSGKSADTLINNNPEDIWISENPNPVIVIDMKKDYEIRAVGHYPLRPIMGEIIEAGLYPNNIVTQYVSEYAIYVSDNGTDYKHVTSGRLRVFGKEELITFEPVKARYLKFEVISSTGRACELPKYADSIVRIGELTVF